MLTHPVCSTHDHKCSCLEVPIYWRREYSRPMKLQIPLDDSSGIFIGLQGMKEILNKALRGLQKLSRIKFRTLFFF